MILIAVAMPGYFGHAESLAEGLGAVFDVEHDSLPAGVAGLGAHGPSSVSVSLA